MTTESSVGFINQKEVFTNILSFDVMGKNPETILSLIKDRLDQKYHLTLDKNSQKINGLLTSIGVGFSRIDVGFNDFNNKLSIVLLNGTTILGNLTFGLEN